MMAKNSYRGVIIMTNCLCDTVKVGQKVQFVPSFVGENKYAPKCKRTPKPPSVVGRVFKVNRNGVIHVEFPVGGVAMRESFTAFDFGTKVRTVK